MSYGTNMVTVTNVTLKRSQRKHRNHRPSNEELARRVDELERTYNEQFKILILRCRC
jgi:hypothetical protein